MKKLFFMLLIIMPLLTINAQNIYKYQATAVECYNSATSELLNYDYNPRLTITFNFNDYSVGYFKLSTGPHVALVSYTKQGNGYFIYSAVTKPNINCIVHLQFYEANLVMLIVYNDYTFKYILYPITR